MSKLFFLETSVKFLWLQSATSSIFCLATTALREKVKFFTSGNNCKDDFVLVVSFVRPLSTLQLFHFKTINNKYLLSGRHLFTNQMLVVIPSSELKKQDNMLVELKFVPNRTIVMIIIKRINTPFGLRKIKNTRNR